MTSCMCIEEGGREREGGSGSRGELARERERIGGGGGGGELA